MARAARLRMLARSASSGSSSTGACAGPRSTPRPRAAPAARAGAWLRCGSRRRRPGGTAGLALSSARRQFGLVHQAPEQPVQQVEALLVAMQHHQFGEPHEGTRHDGMQEGGGERRRPAGGAAHGFAAIGPRGRFPVDVGRHHLVREQGIRLRPEVEHVGGARQVDMHSAILCRDGQRNCRTVRRIPRRTPHLRRWHQLHALARQPPHRLRSCAAVAAGRPPPAPAAARQMPCVSSKWRIITSTQATDTTAARRRTCASGPCAG
jgi:hypothetical protein